MFYRDRTAEELNSSKITFNGYLLPMGVRINDTYVKASNSTPLKKYNPKDFEPEDKAKRKTTKEVILLDIQTGLEEYFDAVKDASEMHGWCVNKALQRPWFPIQNKIHRQYLCRYATDPAPTKEQLHDAGVWLRANKWRFKKRL